jgi:hypothetical protein
MAAKAYEEIIQYWQKNVEAFKFSGHRLFSMNMNKLDQESILRIA